MATDKIQLGASEGGIIEEGSNANGSWTKWADGRMECQGSITGEYDVSVTRGSMFIRYGPTITYPQTFITPPVVHSSYESTNGSTDDRDYFTTAATPNTTQCSTCIWSPVSKGSSVHVINWTATGRWK